MEGIVVGSVVKTVVGPFIDNLISLLKKEFSLIKGVEKDVHKLIRTLATIQAVLEDAEEKQIKDKSIAHWLRDLKDAAYDAEDVLDTWSLKIQQHGRQLAGTSSTNQISCCLSSLSTLKTIPFNREIAKRIKKITNTFDEIAAQKSQFHLNTCVVLQTEFQFNKERETTAVTNEPHIYGRDENKKKIVDILVNDFFNQENVSICPIVGIGGLGKTTLAQSIYNDKTVERHFELKIWVCVSEPFDLERVLKAIIESSCRRACDFITLEAVHKEVEELLREKRYLIVLDDVWNENQDKWNKLKSFLTGGAKGSSFLLTTRSPTVAAMTGTVPPYLLGALSDDDCFSLFMDRALGDRVEEQHANLVAIGKEIAVKCKGVPLVAKSLGSLLRFKTDEYQWEIVRDSEIWNLSETGENTILAALRLSYNHLSSQLKLCFAYSCIYPKDFPMERTKLIYLWITSGFIQSRERMELEQVGDDIFNELLRLSFFQDAKIDDYGITETCKMHDLMHDLASSVVRNECLTLKVHERTPVAKTIRYLTVDCDSPLSLTDIDQLLSMKPRLRTLFFFDSTDFHRFRFSSTLRVLDLSWRSIESLPPSVCDLKHLRFLDLHGNLFKSLPESIYKLKNLQMLDSSYNNKLTTVPHSICKLEHLRYFNISHCEAFTLLPESISSLRSLRSLILRNSSQHHSLPENIRNMSSLRHLDVGGWYMLSKMPVGIGKLTCLQTLTSFVVGSPSDGDSAGISELHHLNRLRGELWIRRLKNVRNGEDAKEANLRRKIYLTKLILSWDFSSSFHVRRREQVRNSSEVLGLFQLPPNIQELQIVDYRWEAFFPDVFIQNLKPPLRTLKISRCHQLVSIPEGLLQNLTSLKRLDLFDCNCLKSLGIQVGVNTNTSSQLQSSLQELYITECPELVFPEEGFQHLNALKKLKLKALQQLEALPQGIRHLPSLQYLKIWLCLNIRMLPEWIKRVTSLQALKIKYNHEELYKRCEPEKGEDWHLISHIPNIEIVETSYKPVSEASNATSISTTMAALTSLVLWLSCLNQLGYRFKC